MFALAEANARSYSMLPAPFQSLTHFLKFPLNVNSSLTLWNRRIATEVQVALGASEWIVGSIC